MLKGISIEGLFDRFDYDINMSNSNVTIITGPNGFGKSTILNIINSFSATELSFFYELDFKVISLSFDNEMRISLQKQGDTLSFKKSAGALSYTDYDKLLRLPWIRRMYGTYYIDHGTMKHYNEENLWENIIESNEFSNICSDFSINEKTLKKFKDSLITIKKLIGEVRYISEQRLLRKETIKPPEYRPGESDSRFVEVVSELPEKLQKEINTISSQYSEVANKLDSTYPKRLLATEDGIKSKEEFEWKLGEANKKFNKLSHYELADMIFIEDSEYDEKYAEALKIYFDDFSAKYEVFEPLIDKLDLFTQIINERLTFKKIQITKKKGFQVVDSDNSDKTIELNKLSSGEKQEIVLFYDLIFNTHSNLVLLIDEPEISLHILWQKNFMNDLLKITSNSNLQVVVATHSPQIINNHWDIQVDLGEKYGS